MIRWKRSWPDLPEELPVDVMPCSNGEFFPPPVTQAQRNIMALANAETERMRRKFGMSRRDFVRTAAAYTIGAWAVGQITGGRWGSYAGAHNTATTHACDLENGNKVGLATLANLPGEVVFDVQSHHVESDGLWRVTNPGFEAFFAAIWSQAGPVTGGAGGRPGIRTGGSFDPGSGDFVIKGAGAGELDPIENLSRFHYIKELFLDSATTITVLSAVPASPETQQPLPMDRAALTAHTMAELSGGQQRTVLHAFVMPNRGSAGTTPGQRPAFLDAELDMMEARAVQYRGLIRGWKTYCPWGDIPYSSGWFLDDPVIGQPFIDKVRYLSQTYGLPANIATHKGFALPAFDQRAASARDIGPAASQNADVNFIVYHSGFDNETVGAYPGDGAVNSSDRTVDAFIKSLRSSGWDATRFIPAGKQHGNVPNVYAELGSVWRSVMGEADEAAHLLGKLIRYVGPKRIIWGTDSLWFGSPHSEIVMFRSLQLSTAAKELYNLPYGLDGWMEDPTQPAPEPRYTIRNAIFGRNAAAVYGLDVDAHLNDRKARSDGGYAINCNEVQTIRDAYILNQATPRELAPLSTNELYGHRTARSVWRDKMEGPWAP